MIAGKARRRDFLEKQLGVRQYCGLAEDSWQLWRPDPTWTSSKSTLHRFQDQLAWPEMEVVLFDYLGAPLGGVADEAAFGVGIIASGTLANAT